MFFVVTTLSLRWIPVAASGGPVPSPSGSWVCTIFIPLALCVMELSSRCPQEGGLYVWTKRAFGDGPAFLTGWMYWTSNLRTFPPCSISLPAIRCSCIPRCIAPQAVVFCGLSVSSWLASRSRSTSSASTSANGSAIWAHRMWIPALIVMVLGFVAWRHFGSATSFAPRNFLPTTHVQDMLFWSVIFTRLAAANRLRLWPMKSRTRAATFLAA